MEKQNKPLLAVALTYRKEEDPAPRLVARGEGKVAEKIVELARQHNVPVREGEELAVILSSLEVGQYIPETLYRAVAEIIAAVIRLDESIRIAGKFQQR